MPRRTTLLSVMPWNGGLNTAVHEALVKPRDIITADNIVFNTNLSRSKRAGISYNWAPAIDSNNYNIIHLAAFNYNNASGSNKNKLIAVLDNTAATKFFYELPFTASPTATALAGTDVWTGAPGTVSSVAYNNMLIMASSNSTNSPVKIYDNAGTLTQAALGGSPTKFSVCGVHQGRLFTNDISNSSNFNKLHYSSIDNGEEWNGIGTSGYITIGNNDGDSEGITAIFPTFQGDLFVAKKTKLYRIRGLTPETWQVIKVSDNIGCVGNNAFTQVGVTDVIFISFLGVHSLATTSKYGDYEGSFISLPIQDIFQKGTLTEITGSYIDYIYGMNSVVWKLGNDLYLYNILYKSWYKWTQLTSSALFNGFSGTPKLNALVSVDKNVDMADKNRLYLGFNGSYIARTDNGGVNDIGIDGGNVSIYTKVKTGKVQLTKTPFERVGLVALHFYLSPTQSKQTLILNINIDQHTTQSKFINLGTQQDVLGNTFILGQSTLGGNTEPIDIPVMIDGQGKMIQFEIIDNDSNSAAKIFGYGIEYYNLGLTDELSSGSSTVTIT